MSALLREIQLWKQNFEGMRAQAVGLSGKLMEAHIQLASAQAELANARAFIESQHMTLATCDAENKNVHTENLRLGARIEKLEVVRVAAENMEREMVVSDELHEAIAAAKEIK